MPSPSGAWRYDPPATPDFFVQAPTSLVRCRTLTPVQKTIYEVLLSYANAQGGAELGQVRLAAEVGVSERTLRSHLPGLMAAGLVSVRRRGQGRTNLYQVTRVPLRGPRAQPGEGANLPVWSGKPRRAKAARTAVELESEERDRIESDQPPAAADGAAGEGGGDPLPVGREQIAADSRLISEATGMDPADAALVAEDAAAQGRPAGYIAELVAHVTSAPSVQNPAGCLRALVRQGKRRPPRGQGGVPARPARPALAPEHYRPGGKYAHLFDRGAPPGDAAGPPADPAPAAGAPQAGGALRGPSAFTIQADPRLAGRGPAAWPRGQPGGGP
jgi:DNA-binding transcriptional ArsR family regulator